jgi:hypothetical protein
VIFLGSRNSISKISYFKVTVLFQKLNDLKIMGKYLVLKLNKNYQFIFETIIYTTKFTEGQQ